jgi:hypothetical protein
LRFGYLFAIRCGGVSDERCELGLAERLDLEQFARRLLQHVPPLGEEPDGSQKAVSTMLRTSASIASAVASP